MVDKVIELQKTATDIKRARAFEAMVKTEGWHFYTELLTGQINDRMKGILSPTPPGGRDASEHNKGTVFGLLLARDLPSTTIATMKDVMAKFAGELDEE